MNKILISLATVFSVLTWEALALALDSKIPNPPNPIETRFELPKTNSHLGKTGPHGGQIVSHRGEKFEIKLDQERKQLDIYAPPPEHVEVTRPDQVGVTLYKDDHTGQTVRLKSVEPAQAGVVHYQGEVSPSEAPYVAVGLQFELSPTPAQTAKPSEDK
jgi:hypothetical protein